MTLATVAHCSAALLPQDLPTDIPESAIQAILNIVASMLTVATFAVATMVTAFIGASQPNTPRASSKQVPGADGRPAVAELHSA